MKQRSALTLLFLSLFLGLLWSCHQESLSPPPPHQKFSYRHTEALADLRSGNYQNLETQLQKLMDTEKTYYFYCPFIRILNTLANWAESDELSGWLKAYPKSTFAHTVMGLRWIKTAWNIRGDKVSKDVPADAWAPFKEDLNNAGYEFKEAQELDPQNPYAPAYLIIVDMGQGKDRATVEAHFQQAVSVGPYCASAFENKTTYLLPQWSGSTWDECKKFVDDSVAKAKPGSRIKLLSVQYLECRAVATTKDYYSYFDQPEVWGPIDKTYTDYLKYNLEDAGALSWFAWLSALCGQSKAAKEIFSKIDKYYRNKPIGVLGGWPSEEKFNRYRDWYLAGNEGRPPGFPQ